MGVWIVQTDDGLLVIVAGNIVPATDCGVAEPRVKFIDSRTYDDIAGFETGPESADRRGRMSRQPSRLDLKGFL